ncbi:MAG TPA: hypothetical protein VFK18_01940 [Luteimonas sp.]|nr:hypothetical protein [Luteimonas sp.]
MSNDTVKVRIYKPHTHAGKRLNPPPEGLEIEVSRPTANWLKEQGLTERPAAKSVADTGKPAG